MPPARPLLEFIQGPGITQVGQPGKTMPLRQLPGDPRILEGRHRHQNRIHPARSGQQTLPLLHKGLIPPAAACRRFRRGRRLRPAHHQSVGQLIQKRTVIRGPAGLGQGAARQHQRVPPETRQMLDEFHRALNPRPTDRREIMRYVKNPPHHAFPWPPIRTTRAGAPAATA